MKEITFTYCGLEGTDKKVRGWREDHPSAKIKVKITKEKHDELIDTGLLNDMSLDDLLNCELEVV